jgi:hypothetical protein
MNLEVTLSDATLADVIRVTVEEYGDEIRVTTLGDAVTDALIERVSRDPRIAGLADRVAVLVELKLRKAAPAFVARVVAAEVAAQLGSAGQGAVTRGEPSTKWGAVVATEVTTQLRAAAAPVVSRHLEELERDLATLRSELVSSAMQHAVDRAKDRRL